MGKKSRLKAEKRTGVTTPTTKAPSIEQVLKAAEDARIMGIYAQLQEAIAREKLLKLNDEPFSHPDNVHKLDLTFGPLEQWLDEQVRTGEADALPDGTVIIQLDDDDQAYYPAYEAFLSMAETYELIAATLNVPDHSDGARKLGARLKVHMPLDMPAVNAARESLAWMRSVTMQLSPHSFQPYRELIAARDDVRRLGLSSE